MDTPNVSAVLRKRIAAALDAGELPALKQRNLRLGSVVLQRADGRDTPTLMFEASCATCCTYFVK